MHSRRVARTTRGERRLRLVAAGLAALAASLLLRQPVSAACPDPFEFLGPSITVREGERRKLDAGQVVLRILEGQGREIAVLGAAKVDFDGDRLAAWMQHIEALKKSRHVPAVGRFSDPPALGDLVRHSLEDRDLDALRKCRPGNCDLKLTASEIPAVQAAVAEAGDNWKTAGQELFRRLMLDRVLAYRVQGHAGIGTYADGHSEQPLVDVAARLLDRSPYLRDRLPTLAAHLTRYPNLPLPGAESFLYWSQEEFGGRPVTTVTHVTILRPSGPDMPDALVAGRQVFATHYHEGSLSLTLLLRGCPGPPHYLVYVNRTEVDIIRGLLGWLTRSVIQGRVEDGAGSILEGLRTRLSRPPGDIDIDGPKVRRSQGPKVDGPKVQWSEGPKGKGGHWR